jgi:hypothetical protein
MSTEVESSQLECSTVSDSFSHPTLQKFADLAEAYVRVLREIDALPYAGSITLSEVETAKRETLDLLTRLATFSISRSVFPGENIFNSSVGDEIGQVPVSAKNTLLGKILTRDETPLYVLVRRARKLNASWAELGKAAGMSPQGMHKAYSDLFDTED